jgi:general nucleoside transport system permease protein
MENIVNGTVVLGTPLLIAAIAGIVAERTGVLNVGLEGFMLGGAFTAAWVAGGTGSVTAAVIVVLAAGLVLGALFGWIVVYLRADQIAVGIAFNIFMLGGTTYAATLVTEAGGREALGAPRGGSLAIPGLEAIPWLGPVFDQHWLSYVGYALVPVAFVVLFRTGLGIRARACGEHTFGAQAAGVAVARWRLGATAISGLLAALAGSYLVLASAHQFVNDISAGKGYIALAVIILARWNPLGAVAAAALFGVAQALDFEVQGGLLGLDLPGELVQTLPYVATILAVTLVGRRVSPPAEDGRPLMVRKG